MKRRSAKYKRKTGETEVYIDLVIDGDGQANVATGIPFFDHMLMLLAKHSLSDRALDARRVGRLRL